MSRAPFHLVVAAPQQILVDRDDIVALRAEDASGSFGLLPGHVDCLTVLTPTVVRWRCQAGRLGYCAINSGVLSLVGHELRIACREGVTGDDLDALEARVHQAREYQQDNVRQARVEHLRLHTQAVRQLVRYLRPGSETTLHEDGNHEP
ncbi:F0F1 ATP synthase subunit epsilon [Halomonas sp. McH1-25]|uniref:F0F1 ATP synthase subunit epsilon n=1 Tax=unclassified Halomonas TaxID=2609666 RepID=UPI001EF52EAE|nr:MULTISPECIES: F0F1 ATP synthase subunit epsilon [unclassified Halomonas]MCG7600886.1 F0F1 ATP synthase subunit epsilon [Halomonas sp. McH1-25]MCP1341474.1 F0F1 ATP synthase subunit epsilon [Halomonas sp. FL8]MCP1360065.1 F0F1 ATP synthase subunit epsilon [Halomonas sp. BBD45]MCP1366139.1 F0F1 ATP synthase subunit epsilon [Halomonas sp. BBD48]